MSDLSIPAPDAVSRQIDRMSKQMTESFVEILKAMEQLRQEMREEFTKARSQSAQINGAVTQDRRRRN